MKLLDCTLRDGGYYTNWDFDRDLINTYIQSFNNLPVDYIEIGYRSSPQAEYLGEFFYCPIYVIENLKNNSSKKLAVIINEKQFTKNDVKHLLPPCAGFIDLIRIAVQPQNIKRALILAEEIKKFEFTVSFNLMYMSEWADDESIISFLPSLNGIVDFLYLVDSYGSVFPKDVRRLIKIVKSTTDLKIGFHGHDNIQMALANTLVAIEEGADVVDATVTGMGRGAGNLKMELLLTVLNSQGTLDVDYNWLSKVTDPFRTLQQKYEWGPNLPYMVSGANSIPQKQVMNWVSKRYYSFNSIIRALSNQSKGITDNYELPLFKPQTNYRKVVIVGGGPEAKKHKEAINQFLNKIAENTCIIHASSKNAEVFIESNCYQIHALSGNEGYRLENTFGTIHTGNNKCVVLPPFPRKMGTYIPSAFKNSSFQIDSFENFQVNNESVTTLCLEIAFKLGCNEIMFVGYDGYDENISEIELELFNENEEIFNYLNKKEMNFYSITPTKYKNLPVESVYSKLI